MPRLTAPVNDYAQVLSRSTTEKLNAILQRQWQAGGSQLTILTIPSLEGIPIEEYSIKVVENWQLGSKSKDNGVLFLLAMKDRKMRIEVGQGLEGSLPDAYARRILDNQVTPFMRRGGSYDQAVIAGVVGILEKTDPQLVEQNPEAVSAPKSRSRVGKSAIVFIIILFWIIGGLFRGLFGGRRRGMGSGLITGAVLGSVLGRGSRGWGGGGGGGWSGGGGGFSGGGSSGSW